ncbi:MAG: glycosyltransferase, partial [Micrococcales bacterium]|nr:glycosyltransferase [Micrococcales bacterium]
MSTRHIGYYIHHHGAGHLTRAVQIMRHCRSRVTGLSSLPRPQGWVGPWIELPRDDVPEAPGDLAPWPDTDAGGVLHWAPLGPGGYRDRMGIVADWLSCHRPDLLVVDVSAEVTLLARLLGVRVAVAAMRGDRTDRAHEASYDVAHLLLAPWPARPRRASEPGWPARWMTKTVYTGGISRFDDRIVRPGSAEPERPARRVGDPLVSVLWGRGGGAWTPAQRLDAQEATPGWRWETAGQDRDVWSSMSAADVVISHAGQNAVAEVAAARRPAVVIALPRPHAEQVATARALAAADLAATCVGLPAAREWPGLLEGARHRDGRAWTRWTDGFGGYRAARAIDAAAAGRALAARTAVITLARGRHDHLRGLLRGLAAGTHVPERLIVVALGDPEIAEVCKQVLDISDGAITAECIDLTLDGEQLPLARARNLGAAAAADLGCRTLIFLDVDCIPASTLVDTYASYAGGTGGTGPASP